MKAALTLPVRSRGVMILALYPDPELDFHLFDDSGFRIGSTKKRKQGVMIPELDFQSFGNSGSE